MWAAATCSNSCCFRSVITRVFGFCLVWTEEKVADAAADSRQVRRSEIGWQPPAPPTSEASSCIWMRWHTRLCATGCSGGCGRRISDAPAPRQCPIAAWCRRQALPCAPSGAATQEHRVLLMFEPEIWGGAYNDYVRTRRRLGTEVSSSTQHFAFGLEAVLPLLLEAGGICSPLKHD